MQVLVYNGSGVSAASRDHALHSLRSFLSHQYDVQLVSPKSLREDPWPGVCSLLVFPGGRDLPYQHDLAGKANARIRDFVAQGGRFLGFCAGAYYASERVEFELGSPLEVIGTRELGFFPGTCRGTVFPGFAYETEAGARQVELELNRSAWRDHWSQSPESASVWYNGGGAFLDTDNCGPNVVVLARYAQVESKAAAGVRCQVGKGVAVLWAVHPEHPTLLDPTSSSPQQEYDTRESRRQHLLRATLAMLDLEVSDVPAPPPRLSPLFLTSPNLALVESIAGAIASKADSTTTTTAEIKDRNDAFTLHPPEAAMDVATRLRAAPGSNDPDVLRTTTKEIIACTSAVPPTPLTPLFDLTSYFQQLEAATAPSPPRFGCTLLYGESVTSTQTMLDKNDRFLSALPAGLACLASHQIAGRGRGANSWVSPAGCLQFSLVLRLPMAEARKIVFVQYLFGLAVVEAVRTRPGYEGVAVRLKWPNDIYGDVGSKGNPVMKKIGGILVNSSYAGADFTLVVGCGVNTSNPRPTTSVNELVALYNAQHGTSLALFMQETLLALVLARFDAMWDAFLSDGFAPFLDSYLERWIHSNQRVTIQATGQVVKIVGITPEHGLLRTIAVNLDRSGNEVYGGGAASRTYVDLQPDGNGFDMVQGLLVSRLPAPAKGQQTEHVLRDLNFSPFNSGAWTITSFQGGAITLLTKASWLEVDPAVAARIETLIIKWGTSTADGTRTWDGSCAVEDFAAGSIGINYVFHQHEYDLVIGFEWSMKAEVSPAGGRPEINIKHLGRLLAPPHSNDCRFVFPREGRELWCNSSILSEASPYFMTLLESEFAEGLGYTTDPDVNIRSALPFDDSDDDDELAAPLPIRSCDALHHTIRIEETAYITYHAVLFWIMTNVIDFAPLRSTLAADAERDPISSDPMDPSLPIPASPKSIYRLAHLLEIPELQSLALQSIKAQITVENVLDELFCETSGLYDEVLDMLVAVTEISWHSVYPAVLSKLKTLTVKTGTVTTKADGSKSWDRIDIVKDFTVGKFTLPYEITQPTSDPVIGFEWTLESDGNGYEAVKHPGNMLSPPHYNDVRFDFPYEGRELWCNSATLSRASPYYKTLFASEFSEGVDVIRYDDLSESDDVSSCASLPFDDSDDDERAEPTTTPLARSCATPHRTIKITETAFSTYHAVLFWIMSDVIEFAPLRSTLSAADRRRNPTPSDPTIPIPASPKSVYRLSHLLELPELQAMALSGLRAQITVTNVLDELFCETSGCYDAILEVLIAFLEVILERPKGPVPDGGRNTEQRISDPSLPPFTSGIWKVHFREVNRAFLVTEISWSHVNLGVLSRLKSMTIRTGAMTTKPDGSKSWYRINTTKKFSTGSFPIPHSFFQPTSDPIIRIEWSIESEEKGYEAAKHQGHLFLAPHFNNVHLIFPREGRELWCNSAMLSQASPYFKTLFMSDFSEGIDVFHSPSYGTDTSSSRIPLPFDDSDDDDEHAEPATLLAPLARPCATPHRTIKITETAYSTYHAALFWIMTDIIEFAPLRSTVTDSNSRSAPTNATTPIPISPKSMYRLAHFLEIEELQEIALEGLKAQITVANVLDELFCETSGCYDAVRDVLIDFVKENKSDMQDQKRKIREIKEGIRGEAWKNEVAWETLAATL
ncbi:hypothetical protein RQP46_008646 [Phenoliferia psychrophenolica]